MRSTLHYSPRLFVENDLRAGEIIHLGADQSHYVQSVMRMKTGDVLRLFNGRDGEWKVILSKILKRETQLTVTEELRPQLPDQDLWLCASPIKRAHFDYMIEKATELGITTHQSVLTSRTQIREINQDRCRAIAIEAAEQSERLSVPMIAKPVVLSELADQWPQGRTLIVCAEWGEALPLHKAFSPSLAKSSSKVAIMTGPEGGFTSDELERLRKIPHVIFIRLGSRILRADTAALAAISCWQALCGDWDKL